MSARIPGWNTLSAASRASEIAALRGRAEALVKGCYVHWKRSTCKIKQLISPDHVFRFELLLGTLENHRSTPEEFLNAADELRTKYPEVRAWIAWWLLPDNAALIFPAMAKMSPQLRARLPDTTNGGESSHWLLYRACGQKFDLWEGIRRLFMFQREQEMLYDAVLGIFLLSLCADHHIDLSHES